VILNEHNPEIIAWMVDGKNDRKMGDDAKTSVSLAASGGYTAPIGKTHEERPAISLKGTIPTVLQQHAPNSGMIGHDQRRGFVVQISSGYVCLCVK
jgi:hypothetical protein